MSVPSKDSIAECLFSRHDMTLVDVKFFRGTRDDLITGEEICAQMKSAMEQRAMGAADVSHRAPISAHAPIDVADFLANL